MIQDTGFRVQYLFIIKNIYYSSIYSNIKIDGFVKLERKAFLRATSKNADRRYFRSSYL